MVVVAGRRGPKGHCLGNSIRFPNFDGLTIQVPEGGKLAVW